MDSDQSTMIHESMVDDWLRRLGRYNADGIEKLASKYRNGDKCTCVKMSNGSFNWVFKVVFDDGTESRLSKLVSDKQEKLQQQQNTLHLLKIF
jgi:hypothetical protein